MHLCKDLKFKKKVKHSDISSSRPFLYGVMAKKMAMKHQ